MDPFEKREPNLTDEEDKLEKLVAPQAAPRHYEISYPNAIYFGYCHLAGLYGLYLCFTSCKWATIFFDIFLLVLGSLSITAGAHRLWTHRSYKAKLPLEIFLMLSNCIAYQYTAITWIRNHRMHHKYSDTDADPHNATRGLFFSHIGWLLVKKHPEIKKRGKYIYMTDILSNPVLTFQKRYAAILIPLFCFILPTAIPMYFWEENFVNAWNINLLRYVTNLNITFTVNSLAHLWGYKPYDSGISPAQNKFVAFLAFGEGFHNYHHVFPWDYRTAEFGNNNLNPTTKFIDFCAWLGLAYDMKIVPDDVVVARSAKTGDGTNLWGEKLDAGK